MGWIKQMELKKALFSLTFMNIMIASILSLLSFWGCLRLSRTMTFWDVEIYIGADTIFQTEPSAPDAQAATISRMLSVLQIALPMCFFVIALFATASLFYRWKLKDPLTILTDGANRIMENDLDFTLEAISGDELGKLCTAFETMRQSLLKNNRELWRQAEERKRLNAAFSHDLRNPVTVLKGSVKIARQCVVDMETDSVRIDREQANGKRMDRKQVYGEWMDREQVDGEQADRGQKDRRLLLESLDRMESYTSRIERYVEIMSNVQRLEQVQPEKAPVNFWSMAEELEKALRFAAWDRDKQFTFHSAADRDTILLDKNMLFQIAENLVSNAVRFAVQTVTVSLCVQAGRLTMEVADDGSGFPAEFLTNGIQPFQKGARENAQEECPGDGHFGMGLYICSLLCQKHGGRLNIANTTSGAMVCAEIKIL